MPPKVSARAKTFRQTALSGHTTPTAIAFFYARASAPVRESLIRSHSWSLGPRSHRSSSPRSWRPPGRPPFVCRRNRPRRRPLAQAAAARSPSPALSAPVEMAAHDSLLLRRQASRREQAERFVQGIAGRGLGGHGRAHGVDTGDSPVASKRFTPALPSRSFSRAWCSRLLPVPSGMDSATMTSIPTDAAKGSRLVQAAGIDYNSVVRRIDRSFPSTREPACTTSRFRRSSRS